MTFYNWQKGTKFFQFLEWNNKDTTLEKKGVLEQNTIGKSDQLNVARSGKLMQGCQGIRLMWVP